MRMTTGLLGITQSCQSSSGGVHDVSLGENGMNGRSHKKF